MNSSLFLTLTGTTLLFCHHVNGFWVKIDKNDPVKEELSGSFPDKNYFFFFGKLNFFLVFIII